MRNKTYSRSRRRTIAREAAQTIVVAGTLVLGATVLAPTATAGPNESCDDDGLCIPYDRGDYDGDGMSNLAEGNFGTSLRRADSDGDSLTDPQEVHQYNTDPWLPDTDTDGSSDRYELDNGTDPLVNDTPKAASPPQAPDPAPAPAPARQTPCIPDPFNLNFPGAC